MNRLLTPQQMSQAEKASEALGVSLWEIQISVRALDIHLKDMEK